jgi:hypothetical protein
LAYVSISQKESVTTNFTSLFRDFRATRFGLVGHHQALLKKHEMLKHYSSEAEGLPLSQWS